MFIQVSASASWVSTETWKIDILSIFAAIDVFQRLYMYISLPVYPDTSNFISAY